MSDWYPPVKRNDDSSWKYGNYHAVTLIKTDTERTKDLYCKLGKRSLGYYKSILVQ